MGAPLTDRDFGRLSNATHWLAQPRVRGRIPQRLRRWLWDRDSLTARLKAHCVSGGFSVRVLEQSWQRPMLEEARALGMAQGERALVREVYLLCDGVPWVFARTLIPVRSLKGAARRLRFLGNRPLGALLFGRPGIRRDAIEVARLTPEHRLFARLAAGLQEPPTAVWGRRTRFFIDGRPLLVNEFFLPRIPELAE